MLAPVSLLLRPEVLATVLQDPTTLAAYVNVTAVLLGVKIVFLAIALFYLIFALTLYIQVRRLEGWLALLKRYHFKRWALVHLVFAAVGWLVALVVL